MAASDEGTVAEGFEPVQEAFGAVATEGEGSADCCVYVDGACVVDLRHGRRTGDLQCVFSATKGAVAACANLLIDRGLLDPEAPVTRYWPEYGAGGKAETLVRWLLEHRAGVLAPDVRLSVNELGDWDAVCAALADATPAWEPGTAYGYHAQSFGWLVGELVRRVDGRGLVEFFTTEIATPAGADIMLGLPEDATERLLDVTRDEAPMAPGEGTGDAVVPPSGDGPTSGTGETDLSQYVGPYTDAATTFGGALPEDALAVPADPILRGLPIAASNGYANAGGLARLYDWLLKELSLETLSELTVSHTAGPDAVLSAPAMSVEQHYSRGFEVVTPDPAETSRVAFGHHGLGGTTAFADPARRLAFAYTTTTAVLGPPGSDPRARKLTRAVYATLTGTQSQETRRAG